MQVLEHAAPLDGWNISRFCISAIRPMNESQTRPWWTSGASAPRTPPADMGNAAR